MTTLEIMGECSTLPLPVYTPSVPSPEYSCDPACDEKTLQQTPRVNRPPPTGAYTKISGGVTVTLFDQENDADIPTYGRRGHVNGTIYFEYHELISQVVLKVCGVLHFTKGDSHVFRLKAKWKQRPPREVLVLSNF
jgi:hypothetical protein